LGSQKELSRLRGVVAGGEIQDNDNSVISFPGSPGSFKWEGVQGSFSPLTSVKRISQVDFFFVLKKSLVFHNIVF